MSSIITRSTRLTQPQGLVTVDWSSPLSRSLAFALSGVSGRDIAKPGSITRTASLASAPTRHGVGFSSSSNAAFSRAVDLSSTADITLSFVLLRRSTAGAQVLIEHTPAYNTNAGSFLIYTDGTAFYAGVSNGGGGASGYNVSQCTAPAAGAATKVVITLRRLGTTAKAARIWFDGVEQATTQPNNGAISGSFANSTTYFLARAASSLYADAVIQDPQIFARAVSDSEAAALSTSPWRIFRPVQRRVVFSAAGGGPGGIDASSSMSTGQALLSAAGALPVTGSASLTSGAATMSAAGDLQGSADGTASMTTAPASLGGTGALLISGSAAMSTLAAMLSASGSLPIVASGVMATGAAVMSADGTVGSDATASASMTTGPVTVAASGSLPITATAAQSTGAAVMSATGNLVVPADGASSMASAPATMSAQGLLQLLASAGMQTSTPILTAFGSDPGAYEAPVTPIISVADPTTYLSVADPTTCLSVAHGEFLQSNWSLM